MISTGRSYEAIRNATRRDHLMPVEPATLHVGSGEVLGIAWLFLVIVPVVVGLWWLV